MNVVRHPVFMRGLELELEINSNKIVVDDKVAANLHINSLKKLAFQKNTITAKTLDRVPCYDLIHFAKHPAFNKSHLEKIPEHCLKDLVLAAPWLVTSEIISRVPDTHLWFFSEFSCFSENDIKRIPQRDYEFFEKNSAFILATKKRNKFQLIQGGQDESDTTFW